MSNEINTNDPADAKMPRGSFIPMDAGGDTEQAAAGELGDDLFDAGTPDRKISAQMLVIATVMIGGGGALYWMRQTATDSGFTLSNIETIDYEESGPPVDTVKQQIVLAALEQSQEPIQVPEDAIIKNPFELGIADDAPDVVAPTPTGDTDEDKMRRLVQSIQLAVEGVQINSVMDGQRPLAKINGELVRPGDKVGEHFVVEGINGRWVFLHAPEIGRTWKLANGESLAEVDPGQR